MKRVIVFMLMIGVSLGIVAALDIKDGLVRIATDDLTLRPMLYRLVNVAGKSKYKPLWYAGDPRTSFIVIEVDGRIYRMGASQEYQTIQRYISNGIEIEYKSITTRVTQRITFATFADSRVANGFTIELQVDNFTSRDMKVKFKEVCDMWLGEKLGTHFALKSNPNVIDETLLDASSNEPYIVSPGDNASIALLLNTAQRPDSVIIANWKRLSDSQFAYDSELMKGFTLAPYSTNDSALGLYWDERIVPAKGTVSVTSLWLTGGPGSEFIPWIAQNYLSLAAEGSSSLKDSSTEKTTAPTDQSPTAFPASTVFDVSDIMDVINKIDSALQNIDTISDADLHIILSELDTLGETTPGSPSPANK